MNMGRSSIEGGFGGTIFKMSPQFMHLHACSSSYRMDVRHRGHDSEKDSHPRNGRRASAQNVPPRNSVPIPGTPYLRPQNLVVSPPILRHAAGRTVICARKG